MDLFIIFGGIGLFLLGMTMLTSGLKEVAGNALKKWLNRFTGGIFSSIFSGMIMTILVQSSTATTLLTIGFVSAGLLTFAQSIGVIIGANIGSTSTGWIIALIGFKISLQAISMPIIGIGVFVQLLAPKDFKTYGSLLTGFGLLFLGIDVLQDGMAMLGDIFSFESLAADTFWMKIALILIGLLMAFVMQASSASMAATLTALFAGAIDFEQAAYLVIGQHIGTTATALFASIGTSIQAKRTAMTHVLFNVVTAIIITIAAPLVFQLTETITVFINGSFDAPLGLAIFHTLFSVLGAIIFVPIIKPFSKIVMKMIPEKENVLTRHLDPQIVSIPAVAIEVSFKTLLAMVQEVTKALATLLQAKKVTIEYEKKMHDVEEAITITKGFLDTIQSKSTKDRQKHLAILHALDHLNRLVKVMREQQKVEAIYLQKQLMEKWQEVLLNVQEGLQNNDKLIEVAGVLEFTSGEMAKERRKRRDDYFERSVANETELEIAVSKVEALLWIDRLVYHYWRATARMAEYLKIG